MNTVIKRISEIEDAASAIMESANASKKSFAQEMEKRTREFDQDLEKRTDQGIEEFRRILLPESGCKGWNRIMRTATANMWTPCSVH